MSGAPSFARESMRARSRLDEPLSKDDLLRACLRGEEEAWRLFLDRYGDLIFSVALRTGASPADAEEIYQSAVLAIYQKIGTLQDHEKLVSWIAGVARRQALYYLRKRSREAPQPDEGLDDVRDPAPLMQSELESLQRGQFLREAFETLRAVCRDLLASLYMTDPIPSYEEVSRSLGIPIGSIGPTRARCLDALRRTLETRGWEMT